MKRAKASPSNISVTANDKTVNAKSMLGILKLGATHGTTVTIEVDGDDAGDVLADFKVLLSEEG